MASGPTHVKSNPDRAETKEESKSRGERKWTGSEGERKSENKKRKETGNKGFRISYPADKITFFKIKIMPGGSAVGGLSLKYEAILTFARGTSSISSRESREKLAHPDLHRESAGWQMREVVRALSCELVLITRYYPRRRYGARGCNLGGARRGWKRREERMAAEERDREGQGGGETK